MSYALKRALVVAGQLWPVPPANRCSSFSPAFDQNRALQPLQADSTSSTGVSYRAGAGCAPPSRCNRKQLPTTIPWRAIFRTLSLANVGDTFGTRDILFPLLSAGKGEGPH